MAMRRTQTALTLFFGLTLVAGFLGLQTGAASAANSPSAASSHQYGKNLTDAERVGAEIWFNATAGNSRFFTYVYQQRLGVMIDWLEPVDKRPNVFFRGYDVYNPVKGGFVTTKQEADTIGLADEREREKLRSEQSSMCVNVPAATRATHIWNRTAGQRQGCIGGISEDAVKDTIQNLGTHSFPFTLQPISVHQSL